MPVGRFLLVCQYTGRHARRQASRQACRMAGWTAGRLERGQACRPACVPILFCLLHYSFVAWLLRWWANYCTTDLYHPNSTSLNPCLIAEASIWCFAVVNQYDSKPVNQRTIETMSFSICMEWLSWLFGSTNHHFHKLLGCYVCK